MRGRAQIHGADGSLDLALAHPCVGCARCEQRGHLLVEIQDDLLTLDARMVPPGDRAILGRSLGRALSASNRIVQQRRAVEPIAPIAHRTTNPPERVVITPAPVIANESPYGGVR